MVTGFHDLGMNFSFAAPEAWVMHGLGAGAGSGGRVCFFFFFCILPKGYNRLQKFLFFFFLTALKLYNKAV